MGARALKPQCANVPAPQSPVVATGAGWSEESGGDYCRQALVCAEGELLAGGRYTCSSTLERDYVLPGELLGTGSSGSVCLAESRADGRRYAVKRLRKKCVTPRGLQDLKSEVEVYLQLDHPHIAQLHQVVETDDAVHLVMELMEGGELLDRLASQQRYSEQEAAAALYQVLLAVEYLHSKSVAHRDLKLKNLMYARKDSDLLKLIDFGLAELWDPSSQMTRPCGSAHYVAPEVVFQSYTPQADMWSVGIIAYMLLTGSSAFHGTNKEVLGQLRSGTPPDFSARFAALSASAQSFVRGLLQQNPLKRLTPSKALEHPWIGERSAPPRCRLDLGMPDCPGDAEAPLRLRRESLLSALHRALPADGHPSTGKWLLSLGARALGEDEFAELRTIFEEVLEGGGLDTELPISGRWSGGSPPRGSCSEHDKLLREVFLGFDCGEPGKPKTTVEGGGEMVCSELALLLEKLGVGAGQQRAPRAGTDRPNKEDMLFQIASEGRACRGGMP